MKYHVVGFDYLKLSVLLQEILDVCYGVSVNIPYITYVTTGTCAPSEIHMDIHVIAI